MVICSNISFSWNMICWEPYISIYTASTFFKSSYIKTLISLHSCSISYNLSQGVLRRTKYSSGVFTVLTANLTCSLSVGLIEQGIVSNYQSNSPITSLFIYLFIYSKLPAFSFNNKILSFFRVLWCSFLIYATGKIEKVNAVSNLNKWLVRCWVGWIYLFIHLFINANIKQFGFSLEIQFLNICILYNDSNTPNLVWSGMKGHLSCLMWKILMWNHLFPITFSYDPFLKSSQFLNLSFNFIFYYVGFWDYFFILDIF